MLKTSLQKILLWGLPVLIAGLIIPSVYFAPLAKKGWSHYPDIRGRLTIDRQGRVWSIPDGCSARGGLSVYENGSWTTYTHSNSGLPDMCIAALAFDKQENIWIGIYDTITVFDGREENFLERGTQIPENSGVFTSANKITAIAIGMDGKAWVGAYNGFSIYDGENWKNFDQKEFEILGPDWNSVLGIDFDNQDRAWIRTSRGITAIDDEKWKTYNETDHSGNSHIFFDGDGRIWISSCGGAVSNSRLTIIDGEKEINYTEENSNMPDGCISSMEFDPSGNPWVIFNQWDNHSQLAIFEKETWSLKFQEATCIAFDKQGYPWICTEKGIGVYNGKTWTTYTEFNSGLARDRVRNIVFDEKSRAWIDSIDEVSVATPSELVDVPRFFVSPVGVWYLPIGLALLWIVTHPAIIPLERKLMNKLQEPTASKWERFGWGFISNAIVSYVILAVIKATIFGILALISPLAGIQSIILGLLGGAGGLIFGSIWPKKYGALIGGLIALIISSPLLFWFGSCVFLGGC